MKPTKEYNGRSRIRMYHCDCMDLMKTGTWDLAIADPPYGYGDKKTEILNFRQKEQHRDWNTAPNEDYFNALFGISENQIIWGGNYFPFIWNFGGRCFIYWHKGNPVKNFADGELAWTSFDQNAKQIDFRYYGNLEGKTSSGVKFHPTQKPVQLYKWLLTNYAKEGDTIFDSHGGSMSIAIACWDLGFDLDICELDTDYFNDAVKRFENHISQAQLF